MTKGKGLVKIVSAVLLGLSSLSVSGCGYSSGYIYPQRDYYNPYNSYNYYRYTPRYPHPRIRPPRVGPPPVIHHPPFNPPPNIYHYQPFHPRPYSPPHQFGH